MACKGSSGHVEKLSSIRGVKSTGFCFKPACHALKIYSCVFFSEETKKLTDLKFELTQRIALLRSRYDELQGRQGSATETMLSSINATMPAAGTLVNPPLQLHVGLKKTVTCAELKKMLKKARKEIDEAMIRKAQIQHALAQHGGNTDFNAIARHVEKLFNRTSTQLQACFPFFPLLVIYTELVCHQ